MTPPKTPSPLRWATLFFLLSPLPQFLCWDQSCMWFPWPLALPGLHWAAPFMLPPHAWGGAPQTAFIIAAVLAQYAFYFVLFFTVFSLIKHFGKPEKLTRSFWIGGLICWFVLMLMAKQMTFSHQNYVRYIKDSFSGREGSFDIRTRRGDLGFSYDEINALFKLSPERHVFALTKHDFDLYLSELVKYDSAFTLERGYVIGETKEKPYYTSFTNVGKSTYTFRDTDTLPLLQRYFIKYPTDVFEIDQCSVATNSSKMFCFAKGELVMIIDGGPANPASTAFITTNPEHATNINEAQISNEWLEDMIQKGPIGAGAITSQ